jgi:predicted MFS family arabinose efflux permease
VKIPPPSPYLVVVTLWLLVFSAASQTMIMSPMLPQIGQQLGVPDSVLGMLVSAYSLTLGVFAILSGPVSDRLGRRRMLLLGSGVMTIALLLHLLANSYLILIAMRIFAGAAGGMLSGAAVSYIGDCCPYNRRGWATGWVMSGSAFGQIVGIPLGIMIAGRWGFEVAFQVFALTMALTFLLIYFRLPQPADVVHTTEPLTVGAALRDYRAMLARPEVAFAAAGFFLMFLGVSMYTVYLPTWLERRLGATDDAIAGLFLFGGVANVLAGPQAGKLSDRIGRKGIVLMACAGLAVVMLLTTLLVREMWMAYPLFFLVMVLIAMRTSPFSALLTSLVSDHRRGSLMSLTVALGQIGFAVGGAIAGPLFAIGYWTNTLLGAISVLAMGLLVWFMVPEPRPTEAAAVGAGATTQGVESGVRAA